MISLNSTIYIASIEKIAKKYANRTFSILITGASGLIGSCMIDVLSLANHKYNSKIHIYVLGRDRQTLMSKFGEETETLTYIIQDINNKLELDFKINYIINLASLADPISYALYPVETILTNIVGTKNMLDFAVKSGAKVIISSSFETYGKCSKDIYYEMDYGLIDFNQLRSGYPESKRIVELLLQSYNTEYELQGNIVRLSSVYGPTMKMNDSKAHAQFLRNALNNQNIVLKSKGTQTRSYTYVIDVVEAILYVAFNGKNKEIYNISNDESIASIAEVAQTIAKISNLQVTYDIPSNLEQKGFSNPQNCILSPNKINLLGWKGRYSLYSGLKETIDILKDIKD